MRLSREIDKRARIAFFVDYVFAITTISLMPKNEVRVRVRVRDHDHLLHTPKNQAGTALEQPHEPSLWHYAPTLYAPILQLLYPAHLPSLQPYMCLRRESRRSTSSATSTPS